MSHRNDGPRGGITYRQAGAAIVLWAVTAGICNLLGGCGTVEGLGRDIQTSSNMVRGWWRDRAMGTGHRAMGTDPEPLDLDARIVDGDTRPFEGGER